MNYRDLSDITVTREFREFIKKYGFNFEIFENILFVWNDNIFLNFFSYSVEALVHIELFSPDLNYQAKPSSLLSEDKIKYYRNRYQGERSNANKLIGIEQDGNPEVLRKAEQYLMFYLQLMNVELGDYFNGRKKIGAHLQLTEPYQRRKLEKFFND